MARQSDEFLIAWSSLAGGDHESGWQTISIAPAGPLLLSAGRRGPDDCEAFMVGFEAITLGSAIVLPEGQGFAVQRVVTKDRTTLWLALTRKSDGSQELFLDMACNVAGALDEAAASATSVPNLLGVFLGRVGAWQEFMRRGAKVMSAETEIGLVGELFTLLEIIKEGVPVGTVVESWVGPLDGVQDFVLGTGALEVKSTLAPSGFSARIGSLAQLDDSVRQPLFLIGMRLSQDDIGHGLPALVHAARESVKQEPAAACALDDRLIAGGYFDMHADRHTRRFKLSATIVVRVSDGFPRLTAGSVPLGVSSVTYDIDLDNATGLRIDITTALKQLGVI